MGGELIVKNNHGHIRQENLSSGEKQLLILFIETLLQREQQYIFITDEPELSLHIQWQRNIIPAIKKLNPNAQIIAATHSPEVASKYRDSIFNMEKLVNAK
ncbi:AAA family ATPase [Escherichia coli]|uniref:AAA family ATPase n=1 Tax=Escherichia coli TaxID=562 RepID=UPI0038CBFBC7